MKKAFLLINIFLYSNSIMANTLCRHLGEYTYIGQGLNVKNWGDDTFYSIGKFCSIADNLTIFLGGNHRVDWISTYPFPAFTNQFPEAQGIKEFAVSKGNVRIGNDVWIGSHVTIL